MNTYLRLFLAGSVGAVAGGSLTHYLAPTHGFLGGITLLLGIMLGALTSAFIFDPNGTKSVWSKALKEALPIVVEARKSLVISVVAIARFILAWAIFGLFTVLCAAAWYSLIRMLGNVGAITTAQTSPDMALGFLISLILMAPAWVAVSVMEDDKTSPKMTIRLHVTTCFKAMLSTNPIGATYFALRFTLWLACKVPTIIRAIVFFILLVTFGLTKCRARTAAMTGAAVGTLVGYLSWNPLLVGLVGGTSASLAHFVSRRFGAWIERTLSEVKAGFSKTAEVKKP